MVLYNDSVVGYNKSQIGQEEKYSPVTNEGNLKLTGNKAYVGKYINKNGKLTIPEKSKLVILKEADISNLVINLEAGEYISTEGKKLRF